MRLSFIPGSLFLTDDVEGTFTVTLGDQVVVKTKARKVAIDKYHEIRKQLEAKYPRPQLTPEQKLENRKQ